MIHISGVLGAVAEETYGKGEKMCDGRWKLYQEMARVFYYGNDQDLRNTYLAAKAEYSKHLCHCPVCRSLLIADASGPDHPDDVDSRLEAWAKERGVE